MNSWDRKFIHLAEQISCWSKDPNTAVGCVVVGPDREIRSTGYNGVPRGVVDKESRYERPEKYLWVEHAERNAIFHAARTGTSLKGCTLYTTHYPCCDCARAIVQSGIAKVVVNDSPNMSCPTWGESFRAASQMFVESGVQLICHIV